MLSPTRFFANTVFDPKADQFVSALSLFHNPDHCAQLGTCRVEYNQGLRDGPIHSPYQRFLNYLPNPKTLMRKKK
jgi:hypothetical protein